MDRVEVVQSTGGNEYDPDREPDSLVRRHILVPPAGSQKNDPIVRGISGHYYPVWAVFLNYRVADKNVRRTLENYGNDLSPEQIEAVARFAGRYPQLVLPDVEAALDEGYGQYSVPRA
jgi:uncharacterized protein (DUF433 family)